MSARSVQIIGDGRKFVAIDEELNALYVIDANGAAIQRGIAFHAGFTTLQVTPAAFVQIFLPISSDTPRVHFLVATDGDVEIQLFENPNVSSQGTVIPNENRNRKLQTVTTNVEVRTGATVGQTGLTIMDQISTSGETFDSGEWILRPNNNYVLRATNRAAVKVDISIGVELIVPDADA